MKVGDLIKHNHSERTAIIVDIYQLRIKNSQRVYAKLLFSHEDCATKAPFDILQNRWEVISAG